MNWTIILWLCVGIGIGMSIMIIFTIIAFRCAVASKQTQALLSKTGIRSYTELDKKARELTEWAVDAREKGYDIGTFDREEKELTIFDTSKLFPNYRPTEYGSETAWEISIVDGEEEDDEDDDEEQHV